MVPPSQPDDADPPAVRAFLARNPLEHRRGPDFPPPSPLGTGPADSLALLIHARDTLRRELRALPARNPAYPSDALLIFADALARGADALALDGRGPAAELLRDIAKQARALAPVFAPPTPSPAALTVWGAVRAFLRGTGRGG